MNRHIKKQMDELIKQGIQAKNKETEGKNAVKYCKATLLPLMLAYDVKSHSITGVGKAIVAVNRGSSINVGKLKESLLLRGFGIEDINQIISDSSSSWETEYISFGKA